MKKKTTQCRIYGGVKANLREEERRKKLIEAGLEALGPEATQRPISR